MSFQDQMDRLDRLGLVADAPGYVAVPVEQLSRWERLVEWATPWTRMGPREWTFHDDRYWDHDVDRRPVKRREGRS